MMCNYLVVFDFDHTIVDGNTDVVVQSVPGFPKVSKEDKEKWKEEDKKLEWNKLMQRVKAQ